MPQGFGFEARKGQDRRSGKERRGVNERRLTERRSRIVPVLLERRIGSDRRGSLRRVAHGPRRVLRDRRSNSYGEARGLRLTMDVRPDIPPDLPDIPDIPDIDEELQW